MSHPKEPDPVLFFVALITKELPLAEKIKEDLSSVLGKVMLSSEPFNFSQFTTYYEKEMGGDLKKLFHFFEILKNPEFLVELKHLCYQLEQKHSLPSGNRRINIDPGYISLSKVVLSTFKDFSHRIYLGKGVFGEVTLIFKNKTYTELSWTYPDYRQKGVIELFNRAREIYKHKLKERN